MLGSQQLCPKPESEEEERNVVFSVFRVSGVRVLDLKLRGLHVQAMLALVISGFGLLNHGPGPKLKVKFKELKAPG